MSGREWEAGDHRQELGRISTEIDRALRAFVDRQPVSEFYDLTRYHFGWEAGSSPQLRSRSILCVLACQACGGSLEAALPLAVAVAFIHEFLVNQRELELDQATNRGRPSVLNKWGRAQAMNAGDGMHALAKVALLEARSSLPAGSILHLEAELDACCLGTYDAIHDELAAGSPASPDVAACTGALLFGFAGYGGAFIAGAAEPQTASLRRFGELLGSAAALQAFEPERAAASCAEAYQAIGQLPTANRELLEALASEVLNSPAGDVPAGSF